MLIDQWRGYFFLNFACEGGKITCSRLVLRLPSNSLCYRVDVKKFSVTMASRFEIIDEEYMEVLKDEWKMKTRRKAWSTGRKFSKSGRMKETLSKFSGVWERCLQFQSLQRRLEHRREWCLHKGTIDVRREYKHVSIEESDSEWSECVLNAWTLFEKALTLYFQSWKFVSRPGFQCPGMFVKK